MKQITLTKGMFAIVDDEDYEDLARFKWHVGTGGYALRMIKHPTEKRKQLVLQMHRYLMGLERSDPRRVDHIDGDKLNNRRSNLRICTLAENARNRRFTGNTSGFKGVYPYYGGRWRAAIGREGKYIHLGVFDTPEAAHAAYCQAADRLHGEFSNHGGDDPDYEALSKQARVPLAIIMRQAGTTAIGKSGYRGVTPSFNGKRWIASISANGVHTYLGTFNTAEEASAAYRAARDEADAAALRKLHDSGEFVERRKPIDCHVESLDQA